MQFADSTKLRAYFMGNMYLSQIQQGIQAAHVVTKMFVEYRPDYKRRSEKLTPGDILHCWGGSGVTKILLNGGYQSNLADVYAIFETICPVLGLPFAKFHEEEAALNGALTSVGVVVPEEVYNLSEELKQAWLPNYIGPGINPFRCEISTPQDVLNWLRTHPIKVKSPRHSAAVIEIYTVLLSITLKSARLA